MKGDELSEARQPDVVEAANRKGKWKGLNFADVRI
jgi:hypothetical protein